MRDSAERPQPKNDRESEIRERVFEKLGKIALALGSPGRLKLIQLLSQAPRTVEELSRISGQSFANTSQHLQRLANEGLVVFRKEGLSRIYRVSSPEITRLWESLQSVGHGLAPELDQWENALTDLTLKSPKEASEVIEEVLKKKALLLDVRDEKEIQATPVEGSIFVPLEKLKVAIKNLPRNKPVFVFCRGRYCHLATDAVQLLRASGIEAYRLRETSFGINDLMKKRKV